MLNGVLNLAKPLGMTSHDVVSVVRRLTGLRAVGHTGTLDPAASGVMIVCLGRATKFARFFESLEKTYWTVLQLGACTDTQDATGCIISTAEVLPYSTHDIRRVLSLFTGSIQQVPPMYSAVKHQGERLYHLARRGQTVIREARDVYIRCLECLDMRQTRMTLSVICSKGTYIRTLGESVGLALGCGAHILHLQRCRVGPYSYRHAWSLEDLAQLARSGELQTALIPLTEALSFLPAVPLSACQCATLRIQPQGVLKSISKTLERLPSDISSYRLCDQAQYTVAVIQRQASPCNVWKIAVTS